LHPAEIVRLGSGRDRASLRVELPARVLFQLPKIEGHCRFSQFLGSTRKYRPKRAAVSGVMDRRPARI